MPAAADLAEPFPCSRLQRFSGMLALAVLFLLVFFCVTTGPSVGSHGGHRGGFPGPDFAKTIVENASNSITGLRQVRHRWGLPKKHRLASFLVIGDWGYDKRVHGEGQKQVNPRCQRTIARSMLRKFNQLGDVKFIINVGDSFYPGGVKSKGDHQWAHKWRSVYHKKLRSVPWYSVYGNHDYDIDPCACTTMHHRCAQHNADINNTRFFYMPNFSYTVHHPELDLEVVALDLNHYNYGMTFHYDHKYWLNNHIRWRSETAAVGCYYTPCPKTCMKHAHSRSKDAFRLFNYTRKHSKAKNLLVFSHYPTDFFDSAPDFLEGLKDPSKNITYFGGHIHNTEKGTTKPIDPNVAWLVGGGGGWGCHGGRQGFVVGQVSKQHKVHTHSVIVPKKACCFG